MGWASAGELFDNVARALVKAGASAETKREALGPLIDKLRDMDWDTEDESCEEFKHDPTIRALFAERGIYPYGEEPGQRDAVLRAIREHKWHEYGPHTREEEIDEWVGLHAGGLADEILAALNEVDS